MNPPTALPAVIRLRNPTPTTHELTEFEDGECYPVELVERFITAYTAPGEIVFDPFAGSGTTMVAAEAHGRRGLGLEIHPERVDWCRDRLSDASTVVCADAATIPDLRLPTVDLVMTSPPYMHRLNHPENPLTGYQTNDGDYRRYLDELTTIFDHALGLLKPTGRLVINAANMCDDGHITALAWDLAAKVMTIAEFEREIVIDWQRRPDWMTMDYCLVFAKRT